MPELPEVETIKRGLLKVILYKRIVRAEVLEPKAIIFGQTRSFQPLEELSLELESAVVGAKVEGLRRFGKALIIDLDNGKSLMIHLRMTGQLVFDGKKEDMVERSVGAEGALAGWLVGERGKFATVKESFVVGKERFGAGKEGIMVGKERFVTDEKRIMVGKERFAAGHPTEDFLSEMPGRHTRVIFEFENGTLYFNDQRKFGFVKVIKTAEVENEQFVRKLAKEPWEMGEEEFYEKLQRHKNALIKAVILDQTIIAGLGNIYADEALFFAGVLPTRRAGEVSRVEAGKILAGAREVMDKSIESGGSTMATYVKADGTRGDYLEAFAQVFGRQGKVCFRCGAEVEKIKVAGRGTHICRGCQK